jgi:hypothetical protein
MVFRVMLAATFLGWLALVEIIPVQVYSASEATIAASVSAGLGSVHQIPTPEYQRASSAMAAVGHLG